MAKAKLSSVTQQWINGKTEKSQDRKPLKHKNTITEKKVKTTLYISEKASKKLWHNRVETGETISHAVERLALQHLAIK